MYGASLLQIRHIAYFAFVCGWLPPPPRDKRLVVLASAILAMAAPVSRQRGFFCNAGFGVVPSLREIHETLVPFIDKSRMGFLRCAHFMAIAYLAYVLAGENGRNLKGPIVEIVRRVDQQALAVFLSGLVVARVLGIVLDQTGRTFVTTAFANLAGGVILITTTFVAACFKSPPWRRALSIHAANPSLLSSSTTQSSMRQAMRA